MRLTTFSDYSLRVLMYLATDPDRRATIAEIAGSFDVSENHLMKVVHYLGKAGWLQNVRGRGGGLQLARPPNEIRIGAVIRGCETQLPAECFDRDTNRCAITGVCRLQHVLAEATDTFYSVLDRYTLQDIAGNRRVLAKILIHPAGPAADGRGRTAGRAGAARRVRASVRFRTA
jgi:Rrf2 family nitric oxide-sensitive transcriptional repressor